jgi:3-deoxy-D-manno-octulosonic-acid transferase
MYFLYNLALALAALVAWPWLLASKKRRAGLGERFGSVSARLRKPNGSCVWIHSVSVGEVLAIAGLVNELRREFANDRVLISTTTATGQKLARERFGEDNVFYFPLDFRFAVRRYLHALRPRLVILAETEFWPNFLKIAKQSGAKIAVVNARISDRSLPGYRRWRGWMRRVLANVDLFLAQSDEDARRLIEIGAAAERVQVGGNLKFDFNPPQRTPFCDELRARLRQSAAFPVLVCGSTVEGEEFALLGSFQALLREYPNAVMVLAPRHPERFDVVAELAKQFDGRSAPAHLNLTNLGFWRRSKLAPDAVLRGGVLLLDSIGELAATYSLATMAFVGGSLVPRGGHNILEPAYFGAPILVGPHTENFRDVVHIFERAGAVRIVRAFAKDGEKGNFGKTLRELLEDSAGRQEMGRRAAEVMRSHSGATARTITALKTLMAAPQREPELAHAEPSP